MTQVATPDIENTLERIAGKIITDRQSVNTWDGYLALDAAKAVRKLKDRIKELEEENDRAYIACDQILFGSCVLS
jgi:hypothetical protein